jgi:hypothetical protein
MFKFVFIVYDTFSFLSLDRRTMEKYCQSTGAVPHPEFMDNIDSIKSVKQLFLAIVSSSTSLDKVVASFGSMDDRK